MSELTNRAAYLKGLADGMKLDKEKDAEKLLLEIVDFLSSAAEEIDAIDLEQGFIADQIDDMEEELDLLEEEIFDYDDEDDEELEICCQNCGEELVVSARDLCEAEVICPECGETIEFDFDCFCEDEDEE